jgi:hypothetical protein
MELIKNELICAITQELPEMAVRTACGHLFDSRALTTWLTTSGVCPVCRTHLASAPVYDAIIQSIIEHLRRELNLPVVRSNHAALYAYGDFDRALVDREFMASGRTGRLMKFEVRGGHHWSLTSGSPHYGRFAERRNLVWLTDVLGRSVNGYFVVERYYVRHQGGPISLLRRLHDDGLFVWDCFEVVAGGYVAYCVDHDKDGHPVQFPLYQRQLSERLVASPGSQSTAES